MLTFNETTLLRPHQTANNAAQWLMVTPAMALRAMLFPSASPPKPKESHNNEDALWQGGLYALAE